MPEAYKFYLDQMFGLNVAQGLRGKGYDVLRASETGDARADDQQILQRAISENRILITLDEHFGDWVILPLSRHPGVIRLRIHPATSRNVLKLRFGVRRAMQVDLSRLLRKDVDVVFMREIGEALLWEVLKNGEVLIEKDPMANHNFRVSSLTRCLDFQFYQKRMQRGMVEAMRREIVG